MQYQEWSSRAAGFMDDTLWDELQGRYLTEDAKRLMRVSSDVSLSGMINARKKTKKEDDTTPVDMRYNPLFHVENYGPFALIAEEQEMVLHTSELTPQTWDIFYQSLLNILKDGIFSEYVQKYMVKVVIDDGDPEDWCRLSIFDTFINIIMWKPLVFLNMPIMPYHLFFEEEITAKSIKSYIDDFVIEQNRTTIPTNILSNAISDMLYHFHDIDQFSGYLCNTLNLEDTADLMIECPEFYQAMTQSYSGIQVDQVNNTIMQDAKKSIEIIKNQSKKILGYDHCLADIWRANEGIAIAQYAEFTIGIGIKPDGRGGVFPEIVDTSFIGGGLVNPVDYFIESSASRIAQIEKHKHVSQSGTLARIMGLNNMDAYLYPSSSYDCGTLNPIPIEIKSAEHLKHLNLRWYRLSPNGQERCINFKRDHHLIGKTILLRSPVTCASAARGHGICYRCYGNLAYTNREISIGRIASELITSKQTQKQLSAKHILKALVDAIRWTDDFFSLFEMENTIIRLSMDIENPSDYRIIINANNIESDNDFDDTSEDEDGDEFSSYDEFITEFDVYQKSTGTTMHITTEDEVHLFITAELNNIIRRKASPSDDYKISIPLNAVKDSPLFFVKVRNNELSKILIKLKNLFNRSKEVRGRTIQSLLQEIIDTNIEGDMGISDIHYELILSHQIRDPEYILERPNWNEPNPAYRTLTLDEALSKNPSVTVSMSYQKITQGFSNPLTYKKNGASFMDLFFMTQPQLVIWDKKPEEVEKKREPGVPYNPFTETDDINKYTSDSSDYSDDGTISNVEE